MNMSAFHPRVSIVIPVYNGKNYLRDAIESALAQEYDNFEVIIVNDGSTDEGASEQIALSYGDRIRYLHKENGGVATALNTGIKVAKGEYISWLSHDDMYYPDKLSKQIEKLEKSKNNYRLILYTNYELVNEKGELISKVNFDHSKLLQKPLYGLLRGCIHGCSLLIPKRAFEEIGFFDPELKTTQDYSLWFQMFRHYSFEHMEDVTIKSRWHPEQDSKKSPHTIREANELWIMFMDELSDKEILSCEKSRYLFFLNLAAFLKETPYKKASEYALKNAEYEKIQLNEKATEILVSVIIPFYNRIDLLKESIESVLSQTHTNFELIIVNDGSTEDISYLNEIIAKDRRTRLISSNTNRGAAYSRNKGIRESSGEYIAFLDADDIWADDKIERQLFYMLSNALNFSHTSYVRFYVDGHNDKISTKVNSGIIFPSFSANCLIATPTVMVSRSIIIENDIFFREEFKYAEDICMWIDIASRNEVGCLDEYLTNIRIHNNNAAIDINKQIQGLLNISQHLSSNYLINNVKEPLSILMTTIQSLLTSPLISKDTNTQIAGVNNIEIHIQNTLSEKNFAIKFANLFYPDQTNRETKITFRFFRSIYRFFK